MRNLKDIKPYIESGYLLKFMPIADSVYLNVSKKEFGGTVSAYLLIEGTIFEGAITPATLESCEDEILLELMNHIFSIDN